VTSTVLFNASLPVSGVAAGAWYRAPGGKRAGRRGSRPCLPKVGETTVEQIPLPGIGLDYPGAQLDGEGGDVAAPLGQGQDDDNPE
jgi:hypothetical protein